MEKKSLTGKEGQKKEEGKKDRGGEGWNREKRKKKGEKEKSRRKHGTGRDKLNLKERPWRKSDSVHQRCLVTTPMERDTSMILLKEFSFHPFQ